MTKGLRPTCEVDRHDNDHLEVKLGFHEPLDYDVDIFFFAPTTLGLSHQNPKIEFLNSMRSYLRLQTSMGLGESAERVSAERLSLEAQRLSDALDKESLTATPIVRAVKNTAIAYEAYLKSRAKARGQSDRASKDSKVIDPKYAQELFAELEQTERVVNRIRHVIAEGLKSDKEIPLPAGSRPPLIRLNEYISFLMLDYLSGFHRHLGHFSGNTELLLENLDNLTISELKVRRHLGLHIDPNASADMRSEYLYNVGLLKKYFQRLLFINVKTSPVAKKAFQPIAAVAAALAAVWASLFQQAQNSNSFLARVGFTPVWILICGILAYVVKDRIKEIVKHFLAGRVERVLPDIQKTLVYEGDEMKHYELGRIRETIRTVSSGELPTQVYDVRYSGVHSGLESELGEDIIHYNKKILLNQKTKGMPDSQWGLREIIRIDLGRYFHNLDDPFKEISFIDDAGKLSRSETHRIYYAHLAIQVSYKHGGAVRRELKLSQLVLDKGGLVKVRRPNGLPDGLPGGLNEGPAERIHVAEVFPDARQ